MSDDQNAYAELTRQVYLAYQRATPKSQTWFERASRALVAGVSGTVRYFAIRSGAIRGHGELASAVAGDEVISGFRLAPGGAQEYYGVVPDLAVFGKAFGVGEKIGAVVGRAAVMAVADPSGRAPGPFAFQSGTGNDSTGALTAALAAMAAYQQLGASGAYRALAALAAQLAAGLRDAFAAHGIACHANQLGPMVRLFLTDGPATYEHCSRLDRRPINLFHLALLTEGVLTIPGSNDFFLSFAHTASDVADIVAAARRVLSRYQFGSIVAQRPVGLQP